MADNECNNITSSITRIVKTFVLYVVMIRQKFSCYMQKYNDSLSFFLSLSLSTLVNLIVLTFTLIYACDKVYTF